MNKSILGITLLLITQTHTANQKHSQPSAPVNIPGATQTGHNFHRTQTLRRNAHIPNQQPSHIETSFSPLPKCTASAPPLIQPDWHDTRPRPTTEEYDAAYRLRQTPSHLYPDLSDQSDMHPNGDDHIFTPVTTLTPPESFFEVPPPAPETLSHTARNEKETALLEEYRRQANLNRLTRTESMGVVEQSLHTLAVARGRTSPTLSTATIRSAPPKYGVDPYASLPFVNRAYAILSTLKDNVGHLEMHLADEARKLAAVKDKQRRPSDSPKTKRRISIVGRISRKSQTAKKMEEIEKEQQRKDKELRDSALPVRKLMAVAAICNASVEACMKKDAAALIEEAGMNSDA